MDTPVTPIAADDPPRLFGRRTPIIGLLLVAAILVLTGRDIYQHFQGTPAGPLACQSCATTVNGLAVPNVNANKFSFNTITLDNRSDHAVVLDRISFVHPSPGIKITGAYVTSRTDLSQLERGVLGIDHGWFNDGNVVGTRGNTIWPGVNAPNRSIVVFFSVPRMAGVYTFSGVRLDYWNADQYTQHYEAIYPDQGRVCLGMRTCSSSPVKP